MEHWTRTSPLHLKTLRGVGKFAALPITGTKKVWKSIQSKLKTVDDDEVVDPTVLDVENGVRDALNSLRVSVQDLNFHAKTTEADTESLVGKN